MPLAATEEQGKAMVDAECLEKAKKRFWVKVDKRGEDECWEWKASRHPKGYGMFRFNRMSAYAHRIAWMLVYGQIPEGLYVCHRCDNPPCCNPDHLFLGTQKDNMLDSALKGRQRIKLSEKDIIEIRRKCTIDRISQIQLAEQFGISNRTISQIVAGDRWAWIEYLPSGGKYKPRTKLSDDDVLEIRRRYADDNITNKKLSDIYCVNQSTISRITSMQRRKGVRCD